jgi:hypothetical protein
MFMLPKGDNSQLSRAAGRVNCCEQANTQVEKNVNLLVIKVWIGMQRLNALRCGDLELVMQLQGWWGIDSPWLFCWRCYNGNHVNNPG